MQNLRIQCEPTEAFQSMPVFALLTHAHGKDEMCKQVAMREFFDYQDHRQ